MDEKNRDVIGEPDENGIRYYTFDSPASLSDASAETAGAENNRDALPGKPAVSGNGDSNVPPGGHGSGGNRGGNGPGGSRKKSLKKPLIIFGCILLAVVLLGVACGSMDKDDSTYANISDDHISVLHISGTISGEDADSLYSENTYNHKWVLNRLDDAIQNPHNKGLILFLDTPGGGVYETDEIYLKLKEYKQTGRPLYSAMGSMAASGGYYISAPADKIIANRNCWTGSIGVTIGTVFDISEFLNKYGIKSVTITAGKNKAMGSYVEPLTKEQKQIFQSMVDEAYEQFVGIVAEGRNIPAAQVKKLADGRIYTAKQALGNGLIDQIGTLEEAISDMKQQYKLWDCDVSEMKYENQSFLSTLIGELKDIKQSSTKSEAEALLEIMNDQGRMPISYMSELQK